MSERDRHGNPVASYPATFRGGTLLGINADGLAEYFDGENVFLAELQESGLRTPPPGYGRAHEISLDAFNWTLPEYLRESQKEKGGWRKLTSFAADQYRELQDNHS